MSLIDSIKSKLRREDVSLEEEPKPSPLETMPELESERDYGEELALRPRPTPQEPFKDETEVKQPDKNISMQFEVINSKLDMIKMQIDSINQALRVISAKLK